MKKIIVGSFLAVLLLAIPASVYADGGGGYPPLCTPGRPECPK